MLVAERQKAKAGLKVQPDGQNNNPGAMAGALKRKLGENQARKTRPLRRLRARLP